MLPQRIVDLAREPTRHETGIKLLDKRIDRKHRPPGFAANVGGVGHHVGAFQNNGANLGMGRDKSCCRIHDVLAAGIKIKRVLIAKDAAGKVTVGRDADDGHLFGVRDARRRWKYIKQFPCTEDLGPWIMAPAKGTGPDVPFANT